MLTRPTVETERKFAFAGAVPDLAGVGEVASVRRLDDELLDEVYYDTPHLGLAAAGITLRCRSGGRDPGWSLKLPVSTGREEVTLAAAAGASPEVPAGLRALVRARSRDRELVPVARIRTHREVRQLLDAHEQVLAELADDHVTTETLIEPRVSSGWRELEVELAGGSDALLEAVSDRLRVAGVAPAATGSRLAAALAGRVPTRPSTTLPEKATAGDAALLHLREHIEELLARDPGVRRDLPDALHKARVATRRLRSALRTYRPVLDRDATDPLRRELAHLATVLGGARDAEVMRARLRAAARALPDELVLGPVLARIDSELESAHQQAHARVVEELDGPRYLALLDALDRLLTAPPLTDRASRPAGPELRRLVLRAWRQLERAALAAETAPTAERREFLLHEARKTAKQVRYAAESTVPVLGRKARKFAKRVTAVQEALGEHQDSVVTRERLRELGVRAHLAGENGFTFGLLHGLEAAHADRAEREYVDLWRGLSRPRVTRWLR